MTVDVAIIGGGAAGLAAGIEAGRRGLGTLIIERNNELGKKILQTGNGRCNISHADVKSSDYSRYNNANHREEFVKELFENVSQSEITRFFENIGIFMIPEIGKTGQDVYLYPESFTALSVRNALVNASLEAGCTHAAGTFVKNITKKNDLFTIDCECNGEKIVYKAKNVILACGGKAAPKSGTDGNLYDICRKFNHSVTKLYPSLVGLNSDDEHIDLLGGCRSYSTITLMCKDNEMAKETGEVQFNKNGLSGIPVFQLSAYGADLLSKNRPGDVKIITDFLPHHSKEELYGMVDRWSESFDNRKLKDFFGGILNGKVVAFIARKLSMTADKSVAKVDKSRLYNFVDYAKECEFNITGSAGFDIAQVTSGGVNLSEINPETCESKIVENLYFAGEIMDVDGPCGGYNLHFAWSSGIAAGKSVH